MSDRVIITNLEEAQKKFLKRQEHGEAARVQTGIDALDELTGGWYPGELCVIGARPAMGKTGLVLSFMANMIAEEQPVAIFAAYDLADEYFLAKTICAVNNQEIPRTAQERIKLLRAADMGNIPLYLCPESELTTSIIRRNVEILIREKGVRCVFILDVQSVFTSEENGQTCEGSLRICHELKMMAREFNVPFVVTSNLNRSPEYRKYPMGRKPQIGDLAGSYGLEQEADSVYLLWRPEFYGIYEDDRGHNLRSMAQILVVKRNYGETGEYYVRYTSKKTFEDMDGSSREKKIRERKRQAILDRLNQDENFIRLSKELQLSVLRDMMEEEGYDNNEPPF